MFNVIAVSNGLTLLRVAVKATEESVPSVTVPPVDQVTAVSSSSIRSIDKVFLTAFYSSICFISS